MDEGQAGSVGAISILARLSHCSPQRESSQRAETVSVGGHRLACNAASAQGPGIRSYRHKTEFSCLDTVNGLLTPNPRKTGRIEAFDNNVIGPTLRPHAEVVPRFRSRQQCNTPSQPVAAWSACRIEGVRDSPLAVT